MTDHVNPTHYKVSPLGIPLECIAYTRHLGFNQGNAAKYTYRAGKKGDTRGDLEKAAWYLRDAQENGLGGYDIGWKKRSTIQPSASVRAELFDLIVGGKTTAALSFIDEILEHGTDLDQEN